MILDPKKFMVLVVPVGPVCLPRRGPRTAWSTATSIRYRAEINSLFWRRLIIIRQSYLLHGLERRVASGEHWLTVTKYHWSFREQRVSTRVEIFWLQTGFACFTGIAAKLKFDVRVTGMEHRARSISIGLGRNLPDTLVFFQRSSNARSNLIFERQRRNINRTDYPIYRLYRIWVSFDTLHHRSPDKFRTAL